MVAIRYADAPLASRAHWFYSGTKMKPTGRSDRLVAPTLLRYEIGSVCLKKLRAYPGQRQGLLEALSLLERLELEELPVVVDEVVTWPGATGSQPTTHHTFGSLSRWRRSS